MDMLPRTQNGSEYVTDKHQASLNVTWLLSKPSVKWTIRLFLLCVLAWISLQQMQSTAFAAEEQAWITAVKVAHAATATVIAGVQEALPVLEAFERSLTSPRGILVAAGFAMVLVQLYNAVRNIRAAGRHFGKVAAIAAVTVLYYTAHTVLTT